MFLSHHYIGNAHRACHHYHCNDTQAHRKLVAYHLRSGTESSDKSKLVVGRPSCEKYTEHTYRGHCEQEEDTDIEINNL